MILLNVKILVGKLLDSLLIDLDCLEYVSFFVVLNHSVLGSYINIYQNLIAKEDFITDE